MVEESKLKESIKALEDDPGKLPISKFMLVDGPSGKNWVVYGYKLDIEDESVFLTDGLDTFKYKKRMKLIHDENNNRIEMVDALNSIKDIVFKLLTIINFLSLIIFLIDFSYLTAFSLVLTLFISRSFKRKFIDDNYWYLRNRLALRFFV